MHWKEAGLPDEFQILDSEDQLRLLRRISAMGWTRRTGRPARRSGSSTRARTKASGRSTSTHGDDPGDRRLGAGSTRPTRRSASSGGLVDFAELLLRAHELWLRTPPCSTITASACATCWSTSSRTPTPSSTPGCACWRATRAHVHGRRRRPVDLRLARRAHREPAALRADFPDVRTVRLEQNYRSTGNILNAANALIAHNRPAWARSCGPPGRAASRSGSTPPTTSRTRRASWSGRIQRTGSRGPARRRDRGAVPDHAQSRLFEEALLRANIPYRVYGGSGSSSAPRSRTRWPTCG
jgi:DNA helicase II / ATP-dependent DNA helicase PcrA